jgi:hypothetical protein
VVGNEVVGNEVVGDEVVGDEVVGDEVVGGTGRAGHTPPPAPSTASTYAPLELMS